MTDTTLTHLQQEIERAKKAHAQRVARLKRAAAAEQRRIDTKVVELLRERKPDAYQRLAKEAGDALAAEKIKRSKRAKQKQASTASDTAAAASAGQTGYPAGHQAFQGRHHE